MRPLSFTRDFIVNYRAPWWLPGGNLQTIWPALFSRRTRGPVPAFGWVVLAVSVLAGPGALVLARRDPASKAAFYGIVVVVGLDLALIVTCGRHLH